MTRKKKCNSKSNSFVAAAEQVCLQPFKYVLEHRQRRSRRNIAGQAIPHLCSSNRKGTTSDGWPTTGRNVKLFSGGGPEPASVRHVGDTCEWRRQVRWCGTMQSTIRQTIFISQRRIAGVNYCPTTDLRRASLLSAYFSRSMRQWDPRRDDATR